MPSDRSRKFSSGEAYAEAERRIAAWRPGEPLDLAIDGLAEIPPDIEKLTELAELWLYVWDEEAWEHRSARGVSDLTPLAGLTGLQSLTCSRTQVSDLAPLAGFTGLQSLSCFGTPISDLTPLAGLTGLRSLFCSGTPISDLTPLAGLTGLRSLDCARTPVSDLAPLAGLTGLAEITLDACRVARWPEGLFEKPALRAVYLHDGALGDVPAEVLSSHTRDNCLPRLRAHFADLRAGAEPMRDAKLMVLGNGRVGKTQLCRALLGEPYDESVPTTHGITVRPWTLETMPDGVPGRLHLWDFGGQDIYHGTHALFLRGRAIFLLAWTPGIEAGDGHVHGGLRFRDYPLPYWLSLARQFGGANAPVLLVQTRVDTLADRRPLPETARAVLAENFPKAIEFQHSARTGRGKDDLREALAFAYARIEQPVIGRVRAAVKRRLEDLVAAGERRTMPRAEFEEICALEGGVADTGLFVDFLHNAGTVFYRPGYFRDELILDQAWAIAAIYAVFERESGTYAAIRGNGGRFSRALLGQLLWDKTYETAEQELLLAMARSCGVCFALKPDQPERGIEAEYLAPDLLPEAPDNPGWVAEIAERRQERRYRHLPGTLIRSIVSAIGERAGTRGHYWRHGVCVYETERRSWGVIEARPDGNGSGAILLRARDGASADLLAALVEIVAEKERLLGLSPEIIDEPGPGPAGSHPEAVPAPDLPETLAYGAPPKRGEDWFFSYANASEEAAGFPVRAFCDAVKARAGVTIRRDVDELKYGDAIEPFMRELAAGDRVFIWLTDAYLRSPYCMFELHEIWRKSGEKGEAFDQRVKVVIGDARIRDQTDFKVYREFWSGQLDAAFERFRSSDFPDDVIPIMQTIREIYGKSDRILQYLRGRIRYKDFEELYQRELGEERAT